MEIPTHIEKSIEQVVAAAIDAVDLLFMDKGEVVGHAMDRIIETLEPLETIQSKET